MFLHSDCAIRNIKGGRHKSAVLQPQRITGLQELMYNFNEHFCISWYFKISMRKSSVSQDGFGAALSGPMVRFLWDGQCRQDDLPPLVSDTKRG